MMKTLITSSHAIILVTLCTNNSPLPQNALIAVMSFVVVMRQQCIPFVGMRQAHPLTSKLYYPHQIELCYSEVRWLNTEPLVLFNIKPQSPGYTVPAYQTCGGIIKTCPIIQSYLGDEESLWGQPRFGSQVVGRWWWLKKGEKTFISDYANCPHLMKN